MKCRLCSQDAQFVGFYDALNGQKAAEWFCSKCEVRVVKLVRTLHPFGEFGGEPVGKAEEYDRYS
jgi:hypothetical protein